MRRKGNVFRSIFPSKIIPSWLLRSWGGKSNCFIIQKFCDNLRFYRHCLKPEVNVWGIVSHLKDPHHFANFINSSEDHITQAEIAEHREWMEGRSEDESGGMADIVKTMFWSKNTRECHGHRFSCILCTDKIIGHRFNCNRCFFDPWWNKYLYEERTQSCSGYVTPVNFQSQSKVQTWLLRKWCNECNEGGRGIFQPVPPKILCQLSQSHDMSWSWKFLMTIYKIIRKRQFLARKNDEM